LILPSEGLSKPASLTLLSKSSFREKSLNDECPPMLLEGKIHVFIECSFFEVKSQFLVLGICRFFGGEVGVIFEVFKNRDIVLFFVAHFSCPLTLIFFLIPLDILSSSFQLDFILFPSLINLNLPS